MNIPLTSVMTAIGAISLAVSGWFANGEAFLSSRVDALSVQQAATAQETQDIDARLTRIESKIDSLAAVATKN